MPQPSTETEDLRPAWFSGPGDRILSYAETRLKDLRSSGEILGCAAT